MADARTYPPGVTSWIDLEVGDLDVAARFYGDLFGWTFETVTPPEVPDAYVVARLDGQAVAGIGGRRDHLAARWNTYVAVADIDAAAATAREAGGHVVAAPEAAGEGGWSAVCADPAGAEFRLWQPNRRLGAQLTNTPGAWNFSDLYALDPDAAATFYGRVFGWVFDDAGFGTLIQVPGYGDHLAATVDPGIHERQAEIGAPPGFADVIGGLAPVPGHLEPGWHVTFTVADRDASADLAERLGGRVAHREDTEWTRDALVVDPQAASFTLSQFAPGG